MKRYILSLALASLFVGCGSSTVLTTPKDSNIQDSESFVVSIKESKLNNSTKVYGLEESVSLEVTMTESVKVDSYVWKESGKVIGNSSKLDKKFKSGKHTVTVYVNSLGSTQSATFTFMVVKSQFETKKLGQREDVVMVDSFKNLMWVNDEDVTKEACLAVHEENLTLARNLSIEFCKKINFAEFSVGEWRVPTPVELSNFIIDTNRNKLSPAYYQDCNFLFADKNGTSKRVATKYGVKNEMDYKNEANETINVILGDIIKFKTHYGIRCVKEINN